MTSPKVWQGLSGRLTEELTRQKRVRLRRVMARRVMEAPPSVAGDTVVAVSPDLELVGTRLSKRRIGARVYQQVQTWFRARGPAGVRPDLELRFALIDAKGKVRRWRFGTEVTESIFLPFALSST